MKKQEEVNPLRCDLDRAQEGDLKALERCLYLFHRELSNLAVFNKLPPDLDPYLHQAAKYLEQARDITTGFSAGYKFRDAQSRHRRRR